VPVTTTAQRNTHPVRRDKSTATMSVHQYEGDQGAHERTVLAARSSVRLLRDYAERTLIKWGLEARIDDVTLVVSELATNAVRARPDAQTGQITFRISLPRGSGLILVEMIDPYPGRPRLCNATEDDVHGRGLLIVSLLAEQTGYRDEPGGGKTVWSTLRIHPGAAP